MGRIVNAWTSRFGRPLRAKAGARLPLVIAGLAVLALWLAILLHLRQEYALDLAHAREESSNLARSVEENIVRTVETVDRTLLIVRELFARDPAHFDLAAWARDTRLTNHLTLQIAITDAEGVVQQSSLGPLAARIDLSDREHFRFHREGAEDAIYISVPVLGRISGKWSIQFTRKLFDSGGRFAGVVVDSLDPYYLSRIYESLGIGNGVVLLVGTDGIVRARAPLDERAIGALLPRDSLARRLSGADHDTFIATSPYDGVERIVSFRRLSQYPLIVSAALDTATVFAGYRTDRWHIILAGIGLTPMVLFAGLLLDRQQRRLLHSRATLTEALGSLEQATAELRRRTEDLEEAHRLARLGTWSWREAEEVLRTSAELSDMLGMGRQERDLDGAEATALVHPDDRAAATRAMQRRCLGGGPLDFEVRLLDRGGKVRHCRVVARRQETSGTPVLRGFCQDISELKQTQAALLRNEKLQLLGHLTGGVAHDFNNLLTVITLNLEEALDRLPAEHVLAPTLTLAHHAAVRGGALVSQLLSYARRQSLRPEVLDLERFLYQAHALLSRAVGDRHAVLLRPRQLDRRCLADPAQLEHALLNLAINARDAMPDGGTIEIETAVVQLPPPSAGAADAPTPGEYLAVAVRDTGSGMPPEVLARVFDPFFTTKEFGKGSGLGLSMVYGFAKQSGGHVEISSEPGQGTCVRLLLPTTRAAASAPPPPPPQAREYWTADGLRALLVEDQADVLDANQRLLEEIGFTVTSALDGVRAFDRLDAEGPFDLLFSDLSLPGPESGLDVARRARSLHPTIPVVLTSGYADHPQLDLPGEGPPARFLLKPYRRADLRALLRDLFAASTAG